MNSEEKKLLTAKIGQLLWTTKRVRTLASSMPTSNKFKCRKSQALTQQSYQEIIRISILFNVPTRLNNAFYHIYAFYFKFNMVIPTLIKAILTTKAW